PLSFESLVARRASVFFTTIIRRPFSCSRRRIWWFLFASIPRGLITATPSTSFRRLAISCVISALTCLLIVHLFAVGRESYAETCPYIRSSTKPRVGPRGSWFL